MSRPLIRALHGDASTPRPRLQPEERTALLPAFADDIHLLEQVSGQSYADWHSVQDRGSFALRHKP